MSKLQSIGFIREDGWTVPQVDSFLARHHLKPLRCFTTPTQYRARLLDPPHGFARFATKERLSKEKRLLLTIAFPWRATILECTWDTKSPAWRSSTWLWRQHHSQSIASSKLSVMSCESQTHSWAGWQPRKTRPEGGRPNFWQSKSHSSLLRKASQSLCRQSSIPCIFLASVPK